MINIIVAVSENNCIGNNGKLPWHLPKDLKRFKQLTVGHEVVMGRNTFESIVKILGKALPERQNTVITHQEKYSFPNVFVVNNLENYISTNKKNIFIIGGGEIYKQSLPFTDCIYRTLVKTKVDGDTFFPEIKESEWQKVEEQYIPKDQNHPHDIYFQKFIRNRLDS